MTRRRIDLRSDRGLTLTELMVYVVLLGIVMIVITGIFASINNAQKTVTAVTSASNEGQVASNLIVRSVSNASAVKLVSWTINDLLMKPGDQMLLVRTAKPDATATWVCQAWYYQAPANSPTGKGNIRVTTSPTLILTPAATALQSWTVIASDVSPATGSAIFNSPVVTSRGTTVSFAYKSTGTDQKPQLIDTSSTTPLGTTGSLPCF